MDAIASPIVSWYAKVRQRLSDLCALARRLEARCEQVRLQCVIDARDQIADARIELFIDTSREVDVQGAMDALAHQSAEERRGKPRRAEDGFAGSALLGGFATAAKE